MYAIVALTLRVMYAIVALSLRVMYAIVALTLRVMNENAATPAPSCGPWEAGRMSTGGGSSRRG